MTPHASVRVGSHNLGDVRLRMMLQGILQESAGGLSSGGAPRESYLKKHIANKVQCETCQILVAGCAIDQSKLCRRVSSIPGILMCKSVVNPSMRAFATRYRQYLPYPQASNTVKGLTHHYCGPERIVDTGALRQGEVSDRASEATFSP